uniref:G-protein coupled receptors family 1 profile domain-containing protein n=1 Tax=Lates calcarifer TaxID=8187 RepID=A0A4W6CC77_LATCA
MKADLNLLFFIFITVKVTLPLEYCSTDCHCDWNIHSVSCFGAEVMPVFHSSTQEVWLVGSKLSSIPQNAFANLNNISHIYISDDDTLRYLEKHSFHNLSRVTHIQLTGMKILSYIDQEAFKDLPNLRYLGITNTGLTSFPGLQYIQSSQEDFILEIVENAFIQVIPANSFSGISKNALTIMLNSNGVKEIQRYAFNGSRLEEVYLHRNVDLEQIDEFAFYGVIHGPTHLDLSETKVSSLPSRGMETIEKLQAKNTWALKALPPLRAFFHLQSAELTFPSHCCGLKLLKRWRGHSEAVICNLTRIALGKRQESSSALSKGHPGHKHLKDSFGRPTAGTTNHNHYSSGPIYPSEQSEIEGLFYVDLPTEDLSEGFDFDVMSKGFLRVLVWVVSLLAISANLLVMFILLTSRQKLSVTRFLMGHLAFADLCMGIYLLFIAIC